MELINKQEIERRFKSQFVIIWKGHYFGCDFENREVREITFEESYGSSFFDWDNNISISSEWCSQMYEEARGEDGCGILSKRYFYNRNDILDFNYKLCKAYEEEVRKGKQQ